MTHNTAQKQLEEYILPPIRNFHYTLQNNSCVKEKTEMEIRTDLKVNGNKSTVYKNVQFKKIYRLSLWKIYTFKCISWKT